MGRPRKPTVPVSTASLTLITLVAIGCQPGNRETVEVMTAVVTRGDIVHRVMVSGTLQPAKSVAVGSQVPGTIQSIDADFNDRVRAGQIVARLDPSIYQARFEEAQARVLQLQADHQKEQTAVDDAQAKLARAEQLTAADVVPVAEVEAARLAADQVLSTLQATAADVVTAQPVAAGAKVSLNDTVIRSPIDGIVIARHVDIGQTVTTSIQTPTLFTIADTRRMQLLTEIAETDVDGLRAGSKAAFSIESIGNATFQGTVRDVHLQTVNPIGTAGPSTPPAGQPATGKTAGGSSTSLGKGAAAYIAVIDVDNESGTVPPGGSAIVYLPANERRDVMRVPNTALTFRPSRSTFAAVGQDPPALELPRSTAEPFRHGVRHANLWTFAKQRFVPFTVDVGISDDYWTEIVDGPLRPGDVVLTDAVLTAASHIN
jgi:HlyD family secretion protein